MEKASMVMDTATDMDTAATVTAMGKAVSLKKRTIAKALEQACVNQDEELEEERSRLRLVGRLGLLGFLAVFDLKLRVEIYR